MKHRALRLLALVGALLLAAGCASLVRDEGPSDGDQLPWNTPAGWEGQGVGLPY
jgi:hypothetical protein